MAAFDISITSLIRETNGNSGFLRAFAERYPLETSSMMRHIGRSTERSRDSLTSGYDVRPGSFIASIARSHSAKYSSRFSLAYGVTNLFALFNAAPIATSRDEKYVLSPERRIERMHQLVSDDERGDTALLLIQDIYAKDNSDFGNVVYDPIFTHLPITNVNNTKLGYSLYNRRAFGNCT